MNGSFRLNNASERFGAKLARPRDLRKFRYNVTAGVCVLPESGKYVQEVPAVNFRREINFYAYMRGNEHVFCSLDAGKNNKC